MSDSHESARRSPGRLLESLLQDVRGGLRALRRQPLFTLVAVASLGLGIGATATVFTWLKAFVIEPLPAVGGWNRLVTVDTRARGGGASSVSWLDFQDWRASARTVDMAAFDMTMVGLRDGSGATERSWALSVSGNYFDVLGVPAAAGRLFLPDDEANAAPVVVLNWGFWQRRFAGDSSVVGRTITLNGSAYTIVGVAAPRFTGTVVGLTFDLFLPVTTLPLLAPWGADFLRARQWQSLDVIGRLRPGVSIAQAAQEVDAIAKQAGVAGGLADHQGAMVRHAGSEGAPNFMGPVLFALLAVAGLVLLIACANVASLLLARASARRREIAVRLAVGASRLRLTRQLLTESLVLAGVAGLTGVLVALWGRDLMVALLPAVPFPVGLDMPVDGRVLLFATGVTAAAALLFGLAPAVQATRPDLVTTLKDEIGSAPGGRARLQAALVVVQVALSLVTLVSAGLFLRSLENGQRMDTGLARSERVLLVGTDLQLAGIRGDSAQVALVRGLLERTRAIPGVEAASLAMLVPLGFGGNSSSGTHIEGYSPRPNENMTVRYNVVGPDYFDVVGTPLVKGRGITGADVADNAPVVVVNETFVRRFLEGREPIGARINVGGDDWLSIVGVVRDGKYTSLTEDPTPFVFRAYGLRFTPQNFTLHVRAAGDPMALAAPLRAAFTAAHGELPFLDVRTLARHTEAAFYAQKIGAVMLAGIGVLALALSAIGIYGTMAYAVSRRVREIGVRIALGAARGDVIGMVVGRAMGLAGAGLVIGLAGALGIGQALRGLLLGVSPRDPLTFAAIGLLLAGVALVASLIPARRAALVDPMIALRSE